MKLYTKTGDDGTSSLMNGKRIKKSDIVFEVLGSLDELSCQIGLAKVADSEKKYFSLLEEVQKTLMKIMADVASDGDEKYEITDRDISFLEENIDAMGKCFEFVLCGNSELSARLDVARCIARRAERAMIKAADSYKIKKASLIYINRLSDFLYALARCS